MKRFIAFFAATLLTLGAAARGQDAPPGMKTIGVDKIAASNSLKTIIKRTGQDETLALLVDSLNEHFQAELSSSNKFRVIAGEDLSRLIDQQQIPIGVIRDNDGKAAPGKIAGLDFLLVTHITEFKDQITSRVAAGQRSTIRTAQATAVVKICNSTTGDMKVIDVPVHEEVQSHERVAAGVTDNGGEDHSLIELTAVDLAKQAVARVVESIYPLMVAAIQDNVVFINRGEGSGIDKDQVYEIYAQGMPFKDPTTGMVLGSTETKVAEVVITDVLPNFSKGRITGNNNGVDVGAVLRMKAAQPNAQPNNIAPGGDPMQH